MVQDVKGNMSSISAPWNRLFPFPAKLDRPAIPDMQKMSLALPHMQAALMKAAIDQQKAMFGFLQQRCDENMKFANQISSASSIGEVISASINFYREAAVQYAAHAGKAAELGSQGTIEVAHDLEQQSARVLRPKAA